MRILTGRRHHITTLAFSPNGQWLAGCGYITNSGRRVAQVWKAIEETLPRHTFDGNIVHPPFSPDNRRLWVFLTGGWTSLDLDTGEVSQEAGTLPANLWEESPDGRWAMFFLDDWESGILRLRGAERVAERWVDRWARDIQYASPTEPTENSEDHWERLSELRFVVNGSRLLLIFRGYEAYSQIAGVMLRVLETETGDDVAEWRGEPSKLIGPHGQLFYLCGASYRVIDTSKFDQPVVTRTNTSRKHFTAAAFSPDGKLLATTSNDTTVTMWDTTTWQPIRQYSWEIGKLRAVAFAPDGLTCAAGSDTGKVVLFDVDG